MEIRGHGGGCCGIRHIRGFYGSVEEVRRILRNNLAYLPRGRAAEVVLTDNQLQRYEPLLLEEGFRKVFHFRNANSGNVCHIYYYHGEGVFVTTGRVFGAQTISAGDQVIVTAKRSKSFSRVVNVISANESKVKTDRGTFSYGSLRKFVYAA